MVGWHHRLNRHEFEQAPGDGGGQGSPACCSPRGCKDLIRPRDSTTTATVHSVSPGRRMRNGGSEQSHALSPVPHSAVTRLSVRPRWATRSQPSPEPPVGHSTSHQEERGQLLLCQACLHARVSLLAPRLKLTAEEKVQGLPSGHWRMRQPVWGGASA